MKNLFKILFLMIFFTSCTENVVETIHGCFDSEACNYNPDATFDNNSCEFESCADCAGVPFGDAEEDDCGICFGDGTYCLPINVTFGNIYINEQEQVNVEILIDNPQDLSGFQFYLKDTNGESGAEILSAEGGLAEEYDFTIVVLDSNNEPTDLVLGYSPTSGIIPSRTSGVLTNLTFNYLSPEVCFELGNGDFIKIVTDLLNNLDLIHDEADGNVDNIIHYSVNFGDCISIPSLN